MWGTVVVTGGLGFIGSAFIRRIAEHADRIVNLDALRYSADEERVPEWLTNVETKHLDVADSGLVDVLREVNPRFVVHFAAETHVTRGETSDELFHKTNVEGTRRVLEACVELRVERTIHVSTDEVYGSALDHPFKEEEKAPGTGHATSTYSRSKAVADDLARDFGTSAPVVIVRPTNCYGPWQHPEKAIPRWTTRALTGRRLPVWGDGGHIRDWMHVDDVCAAIELLLERAPGSGVYNIGPGGDPAPNLQIARAIANHAGVSPESVYLTEYDRPDHDRRYSVDSTRLRDLGWEPRIDLETGLRQTVDWYASHRRWWERLVDEAEGLYRDESERAAQ